MLAQRADFNANGYFHTTADMILLQGPDPRPLLLLVGTPSALRHELAYRLHVAQPTLMDGPIYFWYTIILLYMFEYHIFMTSPILLAVGT